LKLTQNGLFSSEEYQGSIDDQPPADNLFISAEDELGISIELGAYSLPVPVWRNWQTRRTQNP